jgi:hypothetical protein
MLSKVTYRASPVSITLLTVNHWGERTPERLDDAAQPCAVELSLAAKLSL